MEDPPTLRVLKKNGEFFIIMNPLRNDMRTEHQSPIVFKITKSDEDKKRSTARKILQACGVVKKCSCSTLDSCQCLTDCEKAHLKFEMEKISKELCLKPSLTVCDLKEPSDSEIDVEFTPPSAAKLKNPKIKCKPVKVSVAETQYEAPVYDVAEDIDCIDGVCEINNKMKSKEIQKKPSGNEKKPKQIEKKKSKQEIQKKKSKQDVKKTPEVVQAAGAKK